MITTGKNRQKAFTLSETLITLTILGIVAALTVPNLVRRQVEASNRTKIKKAVGVYDSLMAKLTVQNNLKSNATIQEWADDNCSNSSDLFKVVKFVSTGDNKCKFKTADGVFWDITDIQKPIIALKETDLNDATAQSDTNRAFYMFAEYDGQGILRVTETTYDYTLSLSNVAPAKVNESVDRLIAYMKGETTTKLNEIESASNLNCENDDYVCKFKRGDNDIPSCSNCLTYDEEEGSNYCDSYCLYNSTLLDCTSRCYISGTITPIGNFTQYDNLGNPLVECKSGCVIGNDGSIYVGKGKKYDYTNNLIYDCEGGCIYNPDGSISDMSGKLYDNAEHLIVECDSECSFNSNGNITHINKGKKYNSSENIFVDCNYDCTFNNNGNVTHIISGTINYGDETVICEEDCVYDSTTGRIKKMNFD